MGIFLLGYCPGIRNTHEFHTQLVESLAFEVVALRYINEFGPISFKTPAISFQAFQKLKYIAWSMSAAQAGVMAWL